MTFNAQETSVESGAPVELYSFVFGNDPPVRRTNNIVDVVHDELTYTASPIQRGGLVEEKNKKGEKLEITMPGTDELVRKYVGKPPGVRAIVTLTQLHRDDADEEVITQFKGRIQTVDFKDDGHVATMQVVALTGALTRNLPRFTYQGICNHHLYDSRCKISDNDPSFEKFLDIVAVDSDERVITASGAAAFGADFFEGGFVEYDGDYRAIIRQSSDDLTLMLPFATSILGQTGVRILAGCKGTSDVCVSKFDNILNFGGHGLFIATKNLFESGV